VELNVWARWIGAIVLLACGPAVPGGEGGTTGGSSSTTSTQTVTSAGSTSVDPTTSTVTTDDTTTDSDTTTSVGSTSSGCGASEETGEPPKLCGPEPDDEYCYVSIDDESLDEDRPLDVDANCIVSSMTEKDSLLRYELACDEPSGEVVHTLDVTPNCAALLVSDAVHLRALRNFPIDFGLYMFVVVRDTADAIVIATHQPFADEVPSRVDESFYAPITFAAVDMGCEPDRYEPPACGFVVDACPLDETRMAVDFTHEAATLRVWSEQAGDLGSLRVRALAERVAPVAGYDCPFGEHTRLSWTAWRP
jgi:hypothetical protein